MEKRDEEGERRRRVNVRRKYRRREESLDLN